MNADHPLLEIIYRIKTAPWQCVCVDNMEPGAPVELDVIYCNLMVNCHLVWREGLVQLERCRTVGRTRIACRADFNQRLLHSA